MNELNLLWKEKAVEFALALEDMKSESWTQTENMKIK